MLVSYRNALYNFKTDWTKIVDGDTFCSYYISYQKFKKSKIQKWSDHQTSTSRVASLVVNTCAEFESNQSKTVGGDRFWKKV